MLDKDWNAALPGAAAPRAAAAAGGGADATHGEAMDIDTGAAGGDEA